MTQHVLILCTHNSARSVLAEGMLNHWAHKLGRDVQAHSAGSAPSGRINPFAIEALNRAGIGEAPLRVHWGYPGPSTAEGGEAGRRQAFELTRQAIGYRMLQLLALPLATMNPKDLQDSLAEIGRN